MRPSRPLAALVAALLAFELAGCAHRTPITIPPEAKPDPGTLSLAIARQTPDVILQRPGTVGAKEGAKEGAKAGALAPLTPGFVIVREVGDPRAILFGLMLLGAGVALAPVGAGVGAVVGALTAPSSDEVEQSAAALQRAFADADVPRMLTARIIDAGGPRPIMAAADPDSPAADTVLALDALEISLTSKTPGGRGSLRLRMSMHGTLRRASGGEELGTWAWEHEGRKASFVEWGADDARMFRAELERAQRSLAAQVIKDVY